MIATSMSANVFFWIIPGQRRNVAALRAGQAVDPINGLRGKQRSVHNTYFTLPVVFAMLSGHYSFTWSHPQAWLVLVVMMFAGAAIRQFFVARHKYKLGLLPNPLPYALAGVVAILAVIVWLRPAPAASVAQGSAINSIAVGAYGIGATADFGYKTIAPILAQRCTQCHGAQVQMKNLRLDSAARVQQHAQAIYQQVVVTRVMPMNNATGITEAERLQIKAWFEAGAQVP